MAVSHLPWSVKAATIAATWAVSGALAARAFTLEWTWYGLLGAAVAGYAFLDLVTMFVHWTLDNYFRPTTPVFGSLIHYFREHHVRQDEMFRRGYVDNNFEQCFLALPVPLVWWATAPGASASLFMAVAGFSACFITQVHKWAHVHRPPALVAGLQRARLLVDRGHHDRHHMDFTRNYGLLAGWFDAVADRLRVFEALEFVIYLLTGAVAVNSRLKVSPRAAGSSRFGERLAWLGWRTWYGALAWYAGRRGARFTCMNWGYDDGEALVPESAGPERYCLQLYARLTRDVALEGRRLVEVSSGRGGGLAWLVRARRPASAVGVDLVPGNVEVSRRLHGLEFRQGDAEATGLPGGSADVLINVEASHCYPSFPRFLAEARRVLAAGGQLLLTDFRPREALPGMRADFAAAGFDVLEEADVTPHVLAAMRADAPRRVELVRQHAAPFLHRVLLNFAAADPACDTWRRFEDGRYVYVLFRLRAL